MKRDLYLSHHIVATVVAVSPVLHFSIVCEGNVTSHLKMNFSMPGE
jgi:hypothetical protein